MSRGVLLVWGCALLAASAASAQQQPAQPIFGCRASVSCRPSPLSGSAVLDSSSNSTLMSVGLAGYTWRIVTPPPPPEPEAGTIQTHIFDGIHLLPPPEPTVTPAPRKTDTRARTR